MSKLKCIPSGMLKTSSKSRRSVLVPSTRFTKYPCDQRYFATLMAIASILHSFVVKNPLQVTEGVTERDHYAEVVLSTKEDDFVVSDVFFFWKDPGCVSNACLAPDQGVNFKNAGCVLDSGDTWVHAKFDPALTLKDSQRVVFSFEFCSHSLLRVLSGAALLC